MKRFILPIAGSFALLSSSVFAAGPAGKAIGGFEPKTTFTLTVKKVVSTRTKNLNVEKNVPIPSSLPKFKKGQEIEMMIGKDGQLKGPGFSIDFKRAKRAVNLYAEGTIKNGEAATLAKVGEEPTVIGAVLTFYKTGTSGFSVVTNEVVYMLE